MWSIQKSALQSHIHTAALFCARAKDSLLDWPHTWYGICVSATVILSQSQCDSMELMPACFKPTNYNSLQEIHLEDALDSNKDFACRLLVPSLLFCWWSVHFPPSPSFSLPLRAALLCSLWDLVVINHFRYSMCFIMWLLLCLISLDKYTQT